MSWLTDEPEDRRLTRPPVGLVVCQVRHETEYATSDASRALKIKDALGWPADLTENTTQGISVAFATDTGITAAPSRSARGWQMRSSDGKWVATIQPDHFAIETTAYSGWENFRGRLEELAAAVAEHVSPSLEHRIGLRFVNQITHPEVQNPQDWQKFVGEDLFQEKLYESVGDSFSAAMQIIQVQPLKDHTLVMRHGFQIDEDSVPTYILDNDCSRQGSRTFSPGTVMESMEILHKISLQAFEMGTTKALRDHLT